MVFHGAFASWEAKHSKILHKIYCSLLSAENLSCLPGPWDAGRTSARPGSGGRGGSGAPIWVGWVSPLWAPPPFPSVWPGDAPPPARHVVYLQTITYFSDSAGRSEGVDVGREGMGEIEVERGEDDGHIISTLTKIVRQGRLVCLFNHLTDV